MSACAAAGNIVNNPHAIQACQYVILFPFKSTLQSHIGRSTTSGQRQAANEHDQSGRWLWHWNKRKLMDISRYENSMCIKG
jgi:hypothetical protein